MSVPPDKMYLGDGAFAEIDHDARTVTLTAENGITATDRVVLGQMELDNFLIWLRAQGVLRPDGGSQE